MQPDITADMGLSRELNSSLTDSSRAGSYSIGTDTIGRVGKLQEYASRQETEPEMK